MIKGGALYYAIFVSFTTALLCGFIILSSYLFGGYYYRDIIRSDLQGDVRSGINVALKNPGLFSYNDTTLYELYGQSERKGEIKIYRSKWGWYDIVNVSARQKTFFFSKTALVGEDLFTDHEPIALYLADRSNYLSLSGESRIKGTAYLPRLGIKRAHIEGQNYTGEKILYGDIKKASRDLPPIDQDQTEVSSKIFLGGKDYFDYYESFSSARQEGNINNSFDSYTRVLYEKTNISLANISISGNVIILAGGLVEIYSSARLDGIMIFCQRAGIDDGVTGNFQLFAQDTIIVGSGATLSYPSCLTVLNHETSPGHIYIGRDSKVSGGIVLSSTQQTTSPSSMIIETGVKIDGQVYCDGIVEHSGTIRGSLYCNGFFLKTNKAFYESHLLNGKVCFSDLPAAFTGFSLTARKKGGIVRWIY